MIQGLSKAKRDKGQWWERAWSLVDFCTHVSPGCDHCWLATIDHHFNKGGTGPDGRWVKTAVAREDRLGQPQTVKAPTVWAVWSDLFHEALDDYFILRALGRMAATPRHTYLALTKRPERMAELCAEAGMIPFSALGVEFDPEMWPLPCDTPSGERWPANAWAGTSVEGPEQLHRLDELLKVPAPVRWVNLGPWLEDVDLSPWLPGLEWVAVEAESGPGRRQPPGMDALRRLRDQCVAAGVPLWIKQWVDERGRLVKAPYLDGRQWLQMPGAEA